MSYPYAKRTLRTRRSTIRELLKLAQEPDIICFAGGLPSPESFPIKEIREVTCETLEKEGAQALQYTTTEGDISLREQLVKKYQQEGISLRTEDIIVTTGSQQGLDLLSKIFIDPGDRIICGLPSYLGAISTFLAYGAELTGVELDKNGMRADHLENILTTLKKQQQLPKFIYTIPDFQNPAGITMPGQRRKEILEIAERFDVLVVEDSPYREIRFEGPHQKALYELDGQGRVIFLGTFSKTLAPGFRIGWMMANPDILDKVVIAKQTSDLCTPSFVQKIAARYFLHGYFQKILDQTIALYGGKKDLMIQSLEEYMPDDVSWINPEGGLFVFLHLPEKIDTEKMFNFALEKKVAYVPGTVFYCNGEGKNTLRLNFSFPHKEQIPEGIKRLAEAIRTFR